MSLIDVNSTETSENLVKEMRDFPNTYKKTLTELIECVKISVLGQVAKITDNVGHVKFMNGAISGLNILSNEIKKSLDNGKKDYSLLTREEKVK